MRNALRLASALLVSGLLALSLSTCDNLFGSFQNPVDPKASNYQGHESVAATGISLDKTSAVCPLTKTLQLTATASPSDCTEGSFSWATSDSSVASVSPEGLVSGLKAGSCVITVTTAKSYRASCALTVNKVSVTSVALSASAAICAVKGTYQLSALVSPADATYPGVTWTSGDVAVATVDATGLVSGKAVGSATITATSVDGGHAASCAVSVVVPVASVVLNMHSATIVVTGTAQLAATPSPTDATNKSVSWTSSDNTIAKVSATGLVTGVAVGAATITATTADGGFKDTCAVTVVVPVTGLSLSASTATCAVNGSCQLTAAVKPANATNQAVAWSSSNTSVATVSSAGLVTGAAVGSATITATTVDGGYTATCALSVVVPVAGVSLSASSAFCAVGGTYQLTATVSPFNATNPAVTWSSGTTSVATVGSTGLVAGVAVGSATITVKTADGAFSSSCAVSVVVPVSGVSLNKSSLSLVASGTYQLTAAVSPSSATDQNVSWSSSNTSIATVGSGGLVTGIGSGQASITATTENGSYQASCAVTVTVPVTGVSLSASSFSIPLNGTYQLGATLIPSNATDQTVDWSSNDTSIATVNTAGLVTGVGGGSTTIEVATDDGDYLTTCAVSVTVPVTGISLDQSSIVFGQTGIVKLLAATISPSSATDQSMQWSSSDTSVATVDSGGLVKAQAPGSATVTATTDDGYYQASCSVTVDYQLDCYPNNGSYGYTTPAYTISTASKLYTIQASVFGIHHFNNWKVISGSATFFMSTSSTTTVTLNSAYVEIEAIFF